LAVTHSKRALRQDVGLRSVTRISIKPTA
jgi:hypothetical protein